MEVNKVEDGWEYDGVLFADEVYARACKEASEFAVASDKKPYASTKSYKGTLVYDGSVGSSFGKFIEDLLEHHDRNIFALAREFGIGRHALYSLMRGEAIPLATTVFRILKATGCSPEVVRKALLDNVRVVFKNKKV